MITYSQFAFVAALISTVLATIAYAWAMSAGHRAAAGASRRKVLVTASGEDLFDDVDAVPAGQQDTVARDTAVSATTLARYGTRLTWIALAFLTAALGMRMVATGHGPFVTQYEFATSLAWGMLASYCYFEWRYHARTLALFILPMTTVALLYAGAQNTQVDPLVPALQNSLLLTIHIIVAIFAYGAFAISFAAAALTLWSTLR